jgi:hypothetical protein
MSEVHENDAQVKFRQSAVRAAERLLDLGYHVIPLKDKDPYEQGWQTKFYPMFDLKPRILNGDNIGIVSGQYLGDGARLIFLDIDLDQEHLVAAVRSLLPDTSFRIGNPPKCLTILRVRDEEAGSRDLTFYDGPSLGANHLTIQILGRGQKAPAGPKQAAAYGIHPKTGKPYVWERDARRRTIFDMRPQDWPLINDLESLLRTITTAMEVHGWTMKTPRAPAEPGATFDGEMSERMVERDRQLLEDELKAMSEMGPGTLRGTRAHLLGLKIGATIKAGHIDIDDVLTRLFAAMPDNPNAIREFERGVEAAEGYRQAKMAEMENTDWEAEAAKQGVSFEDIMSGAPDAEEFKAEEKEGARSLYRRPLIVAVCDIMYDAIRERGAEDRSKLEGVVWGFMASQLAAGMATIAELDAEWILRAQRLNSVAKDRYTVDAQQIIDGIRALQPTQEAWAVCAADLLSENRAKTPHEAIRIAQFAHKMGPTPKTEAGWAKRIMLAAPMDWDRDGVDIRNERSSNLDHFLAYKLGVWPFLDTFTRRVTFRRLRPFGSMNCEPTDQELAQWGARISDAIAGIYSKATDARALWGADNWSPRKQDVEIWLMTISKLHSFNSVVDRLAAWEPWDGADRVGSWFGRYMGYRPEDPDYRYVCKAGAHWLLNWVARMMRPGHKFDEILAAIGLEGERKTTLFETLADAVVPGAYLGGQKFQFDGSSGINRVAEMTAGKVLVELAELKRLIRLDPEAFKALISGTADSGRSTYGTDSFDQLRQFGFVGTANVTPRGCTPNDITRELLALPAWLRDDRKRAIMRTVDAGFLVDPTGSRRFLPALVLKYKMDLDGLKGEAVQLIAEAKARAEAADFRLYMDDELEGSRAASAGIFAETDGLEDELRAVLEPVEGVEHFRIAAADLKRLLGLQPLAKRSAFKSAAEKVGLLARHTRNGDFYFRGDWELGERLRLMGGPTSPVIVPPSGSGDAGRGFAPG